MTPEQLQQIAADARAARERADVATAGPWMICDDGDSWAVKTTGQGWHGFDDLGVMTERDATFVAAARTDVPLLAAYVETLLARIAELEAAWRGMLGRRLDDPI